MTFKKINKSGQTIVEYVVLTIAVAAIVLFFVTSPHFQNMQMVCNEAFEGAVNEIVK